MSLSRWRDSGGRFEFDGHRIFTRTQGQGPEALLLLHGLPTGSWDYEAMWPALTRRFAHVIAFDFLGAGFSDKPARHRYSIFEQADLALALLRARGVERVHLIAHDYGVSIALELLARYAARSVLPTAMPRLLSGVFLNGGLMHGSYRYFSALGLLRGPLGPLYARMIGPRRFARSFARFFGPQTRPGPIEQHDYWTLLCLQQGCRVLPRLLRYVEERGEQRERYLDVLRRTPVPLRLIFGLADIYSGRSMVERYRQAVAQPDVVTLEQIGHFPHVEAPDRVLRALHAFYDTLPQTDRP